MSRILILLLTFTLCSCTYDGTDINIVVRNMTQKDLTNVKFLDSSGKVLGSISMINRNDEALLVVSHKYELQLYIEYLESNSETTCNHLVDGYIEANRSKNYRLFIVGNCKFHKTE